MIKYLEYLKIIPGCEYYCKMDDFDNHINSFSSINDAISYASSIISDDDIWIDIIIYNKNQHMNYASLIDINTGILEAKDIACSLANIRHVYIAKDLSEVYLESFYLGESRGSGAPVAFIYDYGYLYGGIRIPNTSIIHSDIVEKECSGKDFIITFGKTSNPNERINIRHYNVYCCAKAYYYIDDINLLRYDLYNYTIPVSTMKQTGLYYSNIYDIVSCNENYFRANQ